MFCSDPNIHQHPQGEELGFISALIGVGASFLPALFGNKNPGVAKGLAGITGFGNSVMQELDSIGSQVSQGMIAPQDAYAKVDAAVNALSDGSRVYQAQKGDDAAALAKFKVDAQAKGTAIKALAGQVNQAIATQAAAGQPQAAGAGQILGIDSNILLIGGGVLGLYLVLKK